MPTNESNSEKRIVRLAEFKDRPDDCECSPRFDDLPCWPCYREGFKMPNPGRSE